MPIIRHNAIKRRQVDRSHGHARPSALIEGQQTVRRGDSAAVSAACDAWFRRHGLRPEPLCFGRCHIGGAE